MVQYDVLWSISHSMKCNKCIVLLLYLRVPLYKVVFLQRILKRLKLNDFFLVCISRKPIAEHANDIDFLTNQNRGDN